MLSFFTLFGGFWNIFACMGSKFLIFQRIGEIAIILSVYIKSDGGRVRVRVDVG